MSRHCYSDLNPVLAVGNTALNLMSKGKLPWKALNSTWRFFVFFKELLQVRAQVSGSRTTMGSSGSWRKAQ